MEYISRLIKKAVVQGWLSEEKEGQAKKIVQDSPHASAIEILRRVMQEQILSEDQIDAITAELQEEVQMGLELPSRPTIFYTRDLVKSYKTPEGVFYALHEVCLTVYKGEILAILGFSGSGKSTLLNILGLLTTPDSGSRIYYNGLSYDTLGPSERDELRKKKFGFIFQESHLLGHLSALENVSLPLRLQNVRNGECVERARNTLLSFMNDTEKQKTESFFAKKPGQLSGGQKQRVATARAMVHEPEVVFADEPTGSLDFDTGQNVMNIFLKAVKDRGTTVVLVTHNPSQARQYCSRFIWMENGTLKNRLDSTMDSTIRMMRKLSGRDFKKG
jgi:putative ABC transport system ATP-binding protein